MIFRSMVVTAAIVGSCGGGGSNTPPEERDVSGNYSIRYDDQLKLKLNVGGAVREATANGYGNVVDFGVVNGQPATIDLTQFCAKPEVKCPSEMFWTKVAVTQPDLNSSNWDLQKLVVINDTTHQLPAGQRAENVAGLIDHNQQDKYLLGLGIEGGANQNCAALSISLAGGRFSRVGEHEQTTMEPRTSAGRTCNPDAGVPDAGTLADGGRDTTGLLPDGGVDCAIVPVTRLIIPEGAKVDGIKDGKVFVGWAGGCAFGPFLAGAVLTLETGYTGTRTGNFDPPPYTAAPVVLPDAGLDGGLELGDAGAP
ncbi:MAG: hypothetical protein QM817_01375 [Archangium sp.]